MKKYKNIFLWAPKMGKLVFDLVNQKENKCVLFFLYFLASNKRKEDNPPLAQAYKMFVTKICFAHFRVTVKVFKGPAPS